MFLKWKLGLYPTVWLLDFQGECFKTFAIRDPWGTLGAFVHPATKIGWVILSEGGVIPNHYCEKWRFGKNPDPEVNELERIALRLR